MFLVSPLSTRNSITQLISRPAANSGIVEVGTHRGEYARLLMQDWRGILYCVDPWADLPEYQGQARFLEHSNGNRDEDYAFAKYRLEPWKNRVLFVRSTSEEAVPLFADGSLDLAYIDGNHEYEYVVKDLNLWWPKVKTGGILAGHDIVCPGPKTVDNWGRCIQPAVWEFMQVSGLDVYLIVEEGGLPWSFYVFKE